MREPFVVTIHELMPDQRILDRLYLHDPKTGKEEPLPVPDGIYGRAALSPDRSQLAFEYTEPSATNFHLGNLDLKTGFTRNLTPIPQDRSWDTDPVWRNDGQAILYVHFKRTPKGLLPTLMLLSVPDKSSAPVLEDEPVLNACFSPDGQSIALWTGHSLEILSLKDKKRTVLFASTQAPDHAFFVSGIAWAKTEDKIVFTMFNNKTQRYEIWMAEIEGKTKVIRSFKNGRVSGPSFLAH